jgi:hypothetical protein
MGGVMGTDNGNGMKYVSAIILASLLFFVVGSFAVWIGDDWMRPAFNHSSVPAPKNH